MFAVFAGKLTDMDFSAILEVREKLQEGRTHVHTHYSTGECFAPLQSLPIQDEHEESIDF